MADDRYYRPGVPDGETVMSQMLTTRSIARGRPASLWQARLGGRTAVFGAGIDSRPTGELVSLWARLTAFVDDNGAPPAVDWHAPRPPLGALERPDDAWEFRPLSADVVPCAWAHGATDTARLTCAGGGADRTVVEHLAFDVRLPSTIRANVGLDALMRVRCVCGAELAISPGPSWQEMPTRTRS